MNVFKADMETINNRINTIINELKLTNREFGEVLGITETTVRNLRKEAFVKDIYIGVISNKWNYNYDWIKKGEGKKLNITLKTKNNDIRKLALECMNNWENLTQDEVFSRFLTSIIGEKFNIDFNKVIQEAIHNKKKN